MEKRRRFVSQWLKDMQWNYLLETVFQVEGVPFCRWQFLYCSNSILNHLLNSFSFGSYTSRYHNPVMFLAVGVARWWSLEHCLHVMLTEIESARVLTECTMLLKLKQTQNQQNSPNGAQRKLTCCLFSWWRVIISLFTGNRGQVWQRLSWCFMTNSSLFCSLEWGTMLTPDSPLGPGYPLCPNNEIITSS